MGSAADKLVEASVPHPPTNSVHQRLGGEEDVGMAKSTRALPVHFGDPVIGTPS